MKYSIKWFLIIPVSVFLFISIYGPLMTEPGQRDAVKAISKGNNLFLLKDSVENRGIKNYGNSNSYIIGKTFVKKAGNIEKRFTVSGGGIRQTNLY